MTRGEATALLRLTGLELEAGDVTTLMQRTEGWAAGLYLAALSLQQQPNLERALARFGGDDRVVADYLRDELLSALPGEWRSFLTRTSSSTRCPGACATPSSTGPARRGC